MTIDSTATFTTILDAAQSRRQPYVKLVNQEYTITELFSEENIARYKKMGLESLYIRVKTLILDDGLGESIAELTENGVREILIFCDKDSSSLTSDGFDNFLQNQKIRINFRVAPVSEDNIRKIEDDSTYVPNRDLLGFSELENNKLIYKKYVDKHSGCGGHQECFKRLKKLIEDHNSYVEKSNQLIKGPNYISTERSLTLSQYKRKLSGLKEEIDKIESLVKDSGIQVDHKVFLLNNDRSGKIIEKNHATYNAVIANNHGFEIRAPEYIWVATDPNAEKRQKLLKTNLEPTPELEISTNVDYDIEVTAEVVIEKEEEIVLEINAEQKQCLKLMRPEAKSEAESKAKRIFQTTFYEYYLIHKLPLLQKVSTPLKEMPEIIASIANSDNNIESITCEALDLVVKNYPLFTEGINTNNMPVGLALKDNIIFVSEQRPSSMLENEFTVSLNRIVPKISNPLSYSWLFFATKATISLTDMYNMDAYSNEAPKVLWYDDHPYSFADYGKAEDKMLDSPYTYTFKNMYRFDDNKDFWYYVISERVGFDTSENSNLTTNILPGINFYNLSEQDRIRLEQIKQALEARDILDKFCEIVKSHYINDGGFLLNEKTSMFLEYLFKNILPITDSKKIKFFKEVLEGHEIQPQSDLATVFEGLDGCYKNFKTFIFREEKLFDFEKEKLEVDLKEVLKTQMVKSSNFKVVGQRLMDLLDMSSKRGGLQEQVENLLSSEISLLENPSHYKNAKNWFINVIHPSSALDVGLLTPFGELSKEELKKLLEYNFGSSNYGEKYYLEESYHLLISSFRYLAITLPHQRPSVDTYEQFFEYTNIGEHFNTYEHSVGTDPHMDLYYISGKYKNCPASFQLKTKIRTVFTAAEYVLSTVLDVSYPKIMSDQYIDKSDEYITRRALEISAELDLDRLKRLLENAPKHEEKSSCFVPAIVKTKNANLVTDFTQKQAANNIKLLSLNILSSTGKYYDRQYPDQEFDAYVSLFNILFEKVKTTTDQKIGDRFYAAWQDSNTQRLAVLDTVSPEALMQDIVSKEEAHKKMVDLFVAIFEKWPEFSFAQIIPLGLAMIMHQDLAKDAINNAKILLKYNEHFTQLFRILLSITTIESLENNDYSKLKARVLYIVNVMASLVGEVEGDGVDYVVHELLTDYGNNPENLVFFAFCFAQQETVTYQEVKSLAEKLNNLDASLKGSLLHSYANANLPYDFGKITENLFPSISLDELNEESIPELINEVEKLPTSKELNAAKTRFNDISVGARKYAVVDLSGFASKHGIALSEHVQDKSFQDLKDLILQNDDFIKNVFGHNQDNKKKTEIAFDLTLLMLNAIADHNSTKEETERIISMLFDQSQSLKTQWVYVEKHKINVDKWLNSCVDANERKSLINNLIGVSKISDKALEEVLKFFGEIDLEKLLHKGHTISTLLTSASVEVITKYFDSFKLATESFIKLDIGIALRELYLYIQKISSVDNTISSVKKVLLYCINNENYDLINSLYELDCKIDHMKQAIDWLTSLAIEEIEILKNYVDFNTLLKTPDIDKIKIVADIAIHTRELLSHEQYELVAKQIATHDIYHARLLKSYLLFDSPALSKNKVIEIVMDNIESLSDAQIIFSQYNLERFKFDADKTYEKIDAIKHKAINGNIDLTSDEQRKLSHYITQVMGKAKNYAEWNVNQIRDEAVQLKHDRMLLSNSALEEKRVIDLEYLALSSELIYRGTGLFPRNIQLLAVLLVVISNNHLIQEVATGEGKGMIAALEAAYLWFTGQTVDVITYDQELAMRDLKEFSPFYDSLGIPCANDILRINSPVSAYQKDGINYSTPADLALFRANRAFYNENSDLSSSADVSAIFDEKDGILTSPVNYKLSRPLIPIDTEETRVLFGHILDFTYEKVYTEGNGSRSDDVKNLELYLKHQFTKYSSSYNWPLGELQIRMLKSDVPGRDWYLLYTALSACEKEDIETVFDILLDSVYMANRLKDTGNDFALLREDSCIDADKSCKKKVTPIINDQPSRGTLFSNGVHAFLHGLLKREDSDPSAKYETFPPSATIFNESPAGFVRSYRLTGGRHLGMSGTVEEIVEFKKVNKIDAVQIPRFNNDKMKIMPYQEFHNQDSQHKEILRILNNEVNDRPVILFCDNANEAEQIYELLHQNNKELVLCANSVSDTHTIQGTLSIAGNENVIVITTPMLGRGYDFQTGHENGFVAIVLCEDTTKSGIRQLSGRVARNGQEGTVYSLFNKEMFTDSENIVAHMEKVAEHRQITRSRHRQLSDVLQFFQKTHKGNTAAAMACNKFLTTEWNELYKANFKSSTKKSYRDLRDDLVEAARQEYGDETTRALEKYLILIDNDISSHLSGTNVIPFVEHRICSDNYNIEHMAMQTCPAHLEQTNHSMLITSNSYTTHDISGASRSVPILQVEVPTKKGEYMNYYHNFRDAQYAVMLTHVFGIQDNKFELSSANNADRVSIVGEGSGGSLMLYELKKSFSEYQAYVKSSLVDQISNIVANYQSIGDLDIDKLEKGKWQAIKMNTDITSVSSHSESILTNGKFLLWINRGKEFRGESGFKIFEILQDMDVVKSTLKKLKTKQSQSYTRNAIYDLLKKDPSDGDAPPYVLIDMPYQTIGNCGWTQTEGMIEVIAFLMSLGCLEGLPDKTSTRCQKAIKDSKNVREDFVNYDRIKRIEEIIFSSNEEFEPKFLSEQSQEEINIRRQIISTPIQFEILIKLKNALEDNLPQLKNTIYETQAHKTYEIISLEAALHSRMGKALQTLYCDKQAVKQLLLDYRGSTMGSFEQLDLLYNRIKHAGTLSHVLLFQKVIQSMTKHFYQICSTENFIEQASQATIGQIWEDCAVAKLEENTSMVTLPEIISVEEKYYTYSSNSISALNITNLHEAIRENNIDRITSCLQISDEKPISILLYRSDDYSTALHQGSEHGNHEVMSIIIQGISVEYFAMSLKSENDAGLTPSDILLSREDASQALSYLINATKSDKQKLYTLFNTKITGDYTLIHVIQGEYCRCELGNVILKELPDNFALKCQALTVIGYTKSTESAQSTNDSVCDYDNPCEYYEPDTCLIGDVPM